MEGLFLSIFPKEGCWVYPDAGEYYGLFYFYSEAS